MEEVNDDIMHIASLCGWFPQTPVSINSTFILRNGF